MINIFKKKQKETNNQQSTQEPLLPFEKRSPCNDAHINPSNIQKTLKTENKAVEEKLGWFKRLQRKLINSRNNFNEVLYGVNIDEELYEKLEEALILSDVGLSAANDILSKLKTFVKEKKIKDEIGIRKALIDIVEELLYPLEKKFKINANSPAVIMFVGVNGAGKTTTIGKLAKYLKSQNYKILLAAGDTFRAAACEQLTNWGQKNQIPVVEKQGYDPASVIFEAIKQAKMLNIDVVIADTAGRLSTQRHLMNELKKIKKVIEKAQSGAPHEILLIIDGSNGQNALSQVIAFNEALSISGLIITKLDGSAKGGILAAIAHAKPTPVYFLGIGEHLEDLQPFNANAFANALFEPLNGTNVDTK